MAHHFNLQDYKGKPIALPLASITFDERYYPRVSKVDWRTELRYREAMEAGAVFPPLAVVRDKDCNEGEYVAIDGRHRHGAAKLAKLESFPCRFYATMPRCHWYAASVAMNTTHGRGLTYQDRIAIADRLRREYGWNDNDIMAMLGLPLARLAEVSGRVVERNGTVTVLKSSVQHLAGTRREKDAVAFQSPIANASQRRVLDEMLGMLRSGAFILDEPGIPEKLVAVYESIGQMPLWQKRKKA